MLCAIHFPFKLSLQTCVALAKKEIKFLIENIDKKIDLQN